MTFDPSNPAELRRQLLTLQGGQGTLPQDLKIEGPLHARMGGVTGAAAAPLPAAHPRTLIYRGSSVSSAHPFAIKVYDLTSAQNVEDWIEREAAVLTRLQADAERDARQPLAGRLYAYDAAIGVVVSEWMAGSDLRTWLTLYGRLPGMRLRGIEAAGRWLAAFNRVEGAQRGVAHPAREAAIADEVYTASGLTLQDGKELLGTLHEAARRLDGQSCLVATRHGDFSPNNLLMPGKYAMLRAIDFSLPVEAPVTQDAAQFLLNRSVRLAADLRVAGNGATGWQDWPAFQALSKGYGPDAASAFPAPLMSFFGLVWCVRRMIGLELTSRQSKRAWYDRLDRQRELERHRRLARVFAAHLSGL